MEKLWEIISEIVYKLLPYLDIKIKLVRVCDGRCLPSPAPGLGEAGGCRSGGQRERGGEREGEEGSWRRDKGVREEG